MAAATYVAPKVIFALFRCTLRVTTLWPSNYSTIWVCGLSLVLGCRVSEHVKIRVHREAVRICLKLQSGDVIVLLGDRGEGRMVERSTSGSGERENVALRIILSRYEVLDYPYATTPASNARSHVSLKYRHFNVEHASFTLIVRCPPKYGTSQATRKFLRLHWKRPRWRFLFLRGTLILTNMVCTVLLS